MNDSYNINNRLLADNKELDYLYNDKVGRKTKRKKAKWFSIIGVIIIILITFTLLISLYIKYTKRKIYRAMFVPLKHLLPNYNSKINHLMSYYSSPNPISDLNSSNKNYTYLLNTNDIDEKYIINVPFLSSLKSGDLIMTRHVSPLGLSNEHNDNDDPTVISTINTLPGTSHKPLIDVGNINISKSLQFISNIKNNWTHAATIMKHPDSNLIYVIDITRHGIAIEPLYTYIKNIGKNFEIAVWPLNKPLPSDEMWYNIIRQLSLKKPSYFTGVWWKMLKRISYPGLLDHPITFNNKNNDYENDNDINKNDQDLLVNKYNNHTCASLVLSLWHDANIINVCPHPSKLHSKIVDNKMCHYYHNNTNTITLTNMDTIFAHEILSGAIIWKNNYYLNPPVMLKQVL